MDLSPLSLSMRDPVWQYVSTAYSTYTCYISIRRRRCVACGVGLEGRDAPPSHALQQQPCGRKRCGAGPPSAAAVAEVRRCRAFLRCTHTHGLSMFRARASCNGLPLCLHSHKALDARLAPPSPGHALVGRGPPTSKSRQHGCHGGDGSKSTRSCPPARLHTVLRYTSSQAGTAR